MNQIKLFKHCFALLVIVCLMPVSAELTAQCQEFRADYVSSDCDDNATIPDFTDDTFIAKVLIENPDNPGGTWSSSDGTYTNEPYSTAFIPFGPYPISGGDIMVTILDDSGICPPIDVLLLTGMPCSDPPIDCPDFDLCLSLVSDDGCCATYIAQFSGNLGQFQDINLPSFSFGPTNQIESVGLLTDGGFLANAGVTVNENTISGGVGLTGAELTNPIEGFAITICGDDGQVLTPTTSFLGMFIDGMPCGATNGVCAPVQSYTAMGDKVGGSVYAPGEANCPDTQNHGIEGAEIEITSASGETCQTASANDGSFSCTFCEDGPYEVCVTTTCPEPCGVNTLDLVQLQRYILGIDQGEWYTDIIGDYNGDGRVSAADLLGIRKYILGISNGNRESFCSFFPISTGTDLDNLEDEDNCTTLANANEAAEFVRLMIGDVDFSCSDCVHGDGIGLRPIDMDEESPLHTLYRSPTDEEMYAFTLVVNVEADFDLASVWSPLAGMEYGIVNNQLIAIWIDDSENAKGVSVQKGQPLLEIRSSTPHSISALADGSYISTLSEVSKLTTMRPRSSGEEREVNIGNLHLVPVSANATSLGISLRDMAGRVVETHTTSNIDDFVDFRPVVMSGIYLLQVDDGEKAISYKVFIHN